MNAFFKYAMKLCLTKKGNDELMGMEFIIKGKAKWNSKYNLCIFLQDSEAHLQSWAELLCTILGLFHQLDDSKFTMLLPTVFGSINHMICHAHDMRLKEELAQWLHRVGSLFALAPGQDDK